MVDEGESTANESCRGNAKGKENEDDEEDDGESFHGGCGDGWREKFVRVGAVMRPYDSDSMYPLKYNLRK